MEIVKADNYYGLALFTTGRQPVLSIHNNHGHDCNVFMVFDHKQLFGLPHDAYKQCLQTAYVMLAHNFAFFCER